MSLKLYEYNEAMYYGCVDEETGEIDVDKFNALDIERKQKISDIACMIKEARAEAAAIKAEKQKMEARQKAAENRETRLKDYLAYCLDGEKFKNEKCSIYYKESTSTKVDENLLPETLPAKYQRVTVTPNLTAIKEDLDNGIEIEGCHLVKKSSIVVR